MPRVRIDIAGFYYSVTDNYPGEPTIREVMRSIGQSGRRLTDNGTHALLKYDVSESDVSKRGFLDRIQVDFSDPPKSRQVQDGTPNSFPNLPPCSFAARDEMRVLTAAGVAELTWQYYVNAATFGDKGIVSIDGVLNAEPAGDNGLREIKNFSSFKLTRDCLVTWRLIAIMVGGDPIASVAK